MRVLLQRVSAAAVRVGGEVVGEIGPGVLLLVGVTHSDGEAQAAWLARKIAGLRIFPALDGPSGFDRSLLDIGGGALVVSQFTLYGEARKGRRPDFIQAARPEIAQPLIDRFADLLAAEGVTAVARGRFGADMAVSLINDGPVTLWLEAPAA
ncbi:MAG: D-tyrosyl-tRNA(Tyr) deacylase [Thermoflexales bacterium]|nr:D-tyrosyl-tRNA(Tyr) deacylase [Thermoflexales bacterium]